MAALAETLARNGQLHLLDGIDELAPGRRDRFLARLGEIDWDELARPLAPPVLGDVEQARVLSLDERAHRSEELQAAGEAIYRAGGVAVLMVAGGEGTRLGFPGPKGSFPLAPHSGKTIYQLQAEKVLSLSRRVGRAVPLVVMTSPMTDAATREAFAAAGSYGLGVDQVRFLVQGTVPSLDRDGRALLAEPGRLLESPDGHGGSFTALVGSGELGRLGDSGVTHLVYLQVDNVLAPVDDPVLVGLASAAQADVVTKVLEKRHPDERVGHLVRVAGRDRIVEYTELGSEELHARALGGELVYRWGSPALHCWSVSFLAALADRGYRPPLHRSAKPLQAWVDGRSQQVDGWKYERFVFDLLPEADRSVGMEIDRAAEFAPLKNAEGDDSPATAVELAHRQYAGWLEAAGVRLELPPEARIEISPLYAATREQFLDRWDGRVAVVETDWYLED